MTPNVLQKGLPASFLSEEWRIAVAPGKAYRALVSDSTASTLRKRHGRRLLARVALIWLLMATIASVIVTGRITVPLLLSAALSWSFVLVLQLVIGTVVIQSAPARPVGFARALDLWCASHLPYSLWLLLMAAWLCLAATFPPFNLVLTVVIPAAWTVAISWAYCREVLGASAHGVRWRVALQQLLAWLCVAAYLMFASGGFSSLAVYLSRQLGLRN